jgi:nucleotide-binding universal stress UspA family protein
MISKILVPHDGTEMSDKALEKAVELTKALDAELVLLHVIEQIPIPPSIMLGSDPILIKRARRSVRRELEQGWNKFAEIKMHLLEGKTNVRITSDCLAGTAADQILRYAKTNKPDMIVMASARLEGLSKIKALGSVSRKVSEMQIALCVASSLGEFFDLAFFLLKFMALILHTLFPIKW